MSDTPLTAEERARLELFANFQLDTHGKVCGRCDATWRNQLHHALCPRVLAGKALSRLAVLEQLPRLCVCSEPDPVMQADGRFYCHRCSFQTGARPTPLREVEREQRLAVLEQREQERTKPRKLARAIDPLCARIVCPHCGRPIR